MSMPARIKKSNAQFDQVLKIEQEYASLSNVPFRIVDKFEKKALPGYDFNFAGTLHIHEMSLDRGVASRPVKPQPPQQPDMLTRSVTLPSVKPTAPVKQSPKPQRPHSSHLQTAKPQAQEAPLAGDTVSLPSWIAHSHSKPQSEATVSNAPLLMTSHNNLLFTMDSTSFLNVYERAFTAELKPRNSCKLGVPNPKAIAASESYLAVAYSGLDKEKKKGTFKNMKPNGIVLYRRDNFVVCTIYDKVIELKEGNQEFKSPTGLALHNNHLFVCDRELKSIFKFDVVSGKMLLRAKLSEGEPNAISINGKRLVVSDCISSSLYVFDMDTFEQQKSVGLRAIDQTSGQFQHVVTEDDLIFVKNSESQLSLLDQNLSQRAYFNEINGKILNLALVKQNNTMLVIGSMNRQQQYKFYGYIV